MNTISFPGGFTVLMAVYRNDDVALFNQAVHSVFANTLLPNHCLIVVDGPVTKALDTAIASLEKTYGPILQFLRLANNLGLAQALNAGIEQIHTDWIVRADADDINLPNRFLELAMAIKDHPGLDLLGSHILEIDQEGKPIAIREVPVSEAGIRQFAKTRNPFNHMTVAYRVDAVTECGGYPNVYLREDYALWCQFLSKQKKLLNIPQVLVHATAGKDLYARRGGWKYAKAEWEMQQLLVATGLKSAGRAFIDGLLRSAIFMLPSSIRGFVYQHFLRKAT
ncbi:glycosyltransferase [Polynucleobacter paneuropaeus]|uniref:glycosyltransferase n=1 Tax=Polynucleobacter paneuropaeus TaxID=2527775 RepID=UPI001BFE708F|nr:glycosyltransferase [Polynucleobacter paneuropaeus]QWD52903.1 glycosyltransferase [Polynucleobacter paneuropaeus]QWD57817.1 glycosyltransferase [Polynucleobacter paneuropaeus]